MSFFDGMDGGNNDEERDYGNVPYDPDDKPDGYLGEIFNDNNWSTWGDFYDDKLNNLSGDPDDQRPPLLGDLGEIIIDFYERGILDWADFELRDDGYIDYTIDADTGDIH